MQICTRRMCGLLTCTACTMTKQTIAPGIRPGVRDQVKLWFHALPDFPVKPGGDPVLIPPCSSEAAVASVASLCMLAPVTACLKGMQEAAMIPGPACCWVQEPGTGSTRSPDTDDGDDAAQARDQASQELVLAQVEATKQRRKKPGKWRLWLPMRCFTSQQACVCTRMISQCMAAVGPACLLACRLPAAAAV